MVGKLVFCETMVAHNFRKPHYKQSFCKNPLNMGHNCAENHLLCIQRGVRRFLSRIHSEAGT